MIKNDNIEIKMLFRLDEGGKNYRNILKKFDFSFDNMSEKW
jgi:hypothetical protein